MFEASEVLKGSMHFFKCMSGECKRTVIFTGDMKGSESFANTKKHSFLAFLAFQP
jgi:hypothetical protein